MEQWWQRSVWQWKIALQFRWFSRIRQYLTDGLFVDWNECIRWRQNWCGDQWWVWFNRKRNEKIASFAGRQTVDNCIFGQNCIATGLQNLEFECLPIRCDFMYSIDELRSYNIIGIDDTDCTVWRVCCYAGSHRVVFFSILICISEVISLRKNG